MTAENKHLRKNTHKNLITVFSVLLAVAVLAVSAYFTVLKIGENRLRKKLDPDSAKLPVSGDESLDEEADAYYNGVAYNYNDKLVNILIIGVDRQKPGVSKKHQADALFLVSLDSENKSVNVISISRNTIANVDSYDINGDYFATSKQQLCLAYTYGSDDKQSSELTTKAVSGFLYGIPISGYYTIFMNSLKNIVDSVGGVPVSISENMTAVNPSFKSGADITLTGSNVLTYLRYRGESNAPRLERQKSFIKSFTAQAKKAVLKDLTLPIKMYNKLSSNTVTNVDATSAAYLASEALKASFDFRGVEGVNGSDGTYETFTADETQLYELLLDVFYIKQ